MSRPRRLESFTYVGVARYFLTICTRDRHSAFCNEQVVAETIGQFRRAARNEKFAILAYCVMPDHAHFLVEGTSDTSDLRRLIKMAKQHSGAAYALRGGQRLWQEGYYERVVRHDEQIRDIARYIVWSPVRAGLVATPRDYPYLGSDVWSIEELLDP